MNRISHPKRSRALAVLLAAVMLLTLLTACSGGSDPYATLSDETAQNLALNVREEFLRSADSIRNLDTNPQEEAAVFAPQTARLLLSAAEISVVKIENDTVTYRIVAPDMKEVMERSLKQSEEKTGGNYTLNYLESTIFSMLNQKAYTTAEHTVSVVATKVDGRYSIEPTVELADALLGGLIEYYKTIANEGGEQQ